MNFATFDPRNIVGTILRKYRIPTFAFYSLQRESRVSRWKIERALRGEVHFEAYEAEHLVRLARECQALADSFPIEEDGEPFQFEWRDTTAISSLLKARRENSEKEGLRQRDQQNSQRKEAVINSL